jgi:hypothetical protein
MTAAALSPGALNKVATGAANIIVTMRSILSNQLKFAAWAAGGSRTIGLEV